MNNTTPIEYKVYIDCITFNHAPYIKDAMNGFCMQQTDFPFVAVIVDDASTDGEPETIKQYLHEHFDLEDEAVAIHEETDDYVFTYARHKENTNCFFAVYLLKYNHYSIKKSKQPYFDKWQKASQYVAFCEGDDFWTRPDKLQKQVDFLETHPEYTMCFHQVDVKVEEGRDESEKKKFDFLREGEYTREDQLRMGRIVPTCSIVMPMSIYQKYPYHPKFTIGDNILVCTALTYGNIWCMEPVMGVYRLVSGGWTAMSDLGICRSMFSHYQGMLESFDWYRCKRGYDWFKFWTFSLLWRLKDSVGGGKNQEFEMVSHEYMEFMGVTNLREFWRFYWTRKCRKLLRTVFGEKFVSQLRNKSSIKQKLAGLVRKRSRLKPPS